MSDCRIFGRPLKESQWREERNYKSCPNCSKVNGQEHVYYEYPKYFGTTDARITSSNPDGAQSHCAACRGRGPASPEIKLCSEF